MWFFVTVMPLEIVDPDAETARAWAREELSKSVYSTDLSPVAKFLKWLMSIINIKPDVSMIIFSTEKIILLTFGIIFIAMFFLSILWSKRSGIFDKTNASSIITGGIFDDEINTADGFIQSAQLAAKNKHWEYAYLQSFRGLVMRGFEKGIISDPQTLTARRACFSLSKAAPGQSQRLFRFAAGFNAIRFGDQKTTENTVNELIALTQELQGSLEPQAFTQNPNKNESELNNSYIDFGIYEWALSAPWGTDKTQIKQD